MNRLVASLIAGLLSLTLVPGNTAALTTVNGSSLFTLSASQSDYSKLAVNFNNAVAQTAAEYPPVGAGYATVTLTPLSGQTTVVALKLYNLGVANRPDGSKLLTFAGLSEDNRCFTGTLLGTPSEAQADLTIGPLPCTGVDVTYSGTGTMSFSYTPTG